MAIIVSNANNFSEFISSGVDPRTGAYSLSFNLGTLRSNKLSGPNFNAVIRHNALNSHEGVFGVGWELHISSFDKSTRVLTFQTGQRFKIEWNNAKGEYDIPYRRCKDVRVFYKSKSDGATGEILIAHKNGTKEYIDWDEGTVSRIFSPHGHRIDFHYSDFNNKRVLWKVTDTAENKLHIDWWSVEGQTLVSVYSGSDLKERTTLWKDGDGLLQHISLPDDDSLYTTMQYRYVSACAAQLITQVTHPSGLVEDVTYRDEGHHLQMGAPLTKLPYVIRTVLTAGENQESTITDYEYSDFNYLGYSSDSSWQPGKDVLFSATNSYKYSSSEIVGNLKITRVYNKFHLLEEEYYFMDDVLYQHQKNTYFANLSWPIDYQPPNYSFVKTEAVTFYVNGESRTESIERSVDDYGNETWLKNEDGSEIRRVFYSKSGESVRGKMKCPPHPYGMVRFMKKETLKPASNQHGEVERVKWLTYRKMESLVDGEYFVAPDEQINHNSKIMFDYCQDKNKPYEYGRLKQRKTVVNNTESLLMSDYIFSSEGLEIKNSIETHDRYFASKSEWFDYVSGSMKRSMDDNGVVIDVKHNSLGMVKSEVVAPDTGKEKHKTYVYQHGHDQNQVVVTDNSGVSQTYRFNNAGNLIRKFIIDKNGVERLVEERNYNHLSQLLEVISHDWCEIRDANTGTISTEVISKSEAYEYDQWGEVSKLTRPDGVVEYMYKNPVTLSVHSGLEGLNYQWSTYNIVGKELTATFYDKNGVKISTTSNRYDGYHRLRESTDASNQVTRYAYDDCDRMTEQYSVTEGTEIRLSLEYESFSTADLASAIKVNGQVMGSRQYDGLGRIKNESKLGGNTAFFYEGSSAKASRITTPNGNTLAIRYDLYLNEVVSITEAADATVSCSYIYDGGTGYLEEESTLYTKNVYRYNAIGQLTTESVTLGDSTERKAVFEYSLLGNVLYETDFSGVKKFVDYDDLGRVQIINFEDRGHRSSIQIHYDEFGRECGFTSKSGANTLETRVEFDAAGREELRTIQVNGQLNTRIDNAYHSNGLVRTRKMTNHLGVTTEMLEYDDLNRLKRYHCVGAELPKDPQGHLIRTQTYTYDPFGNIEKVFSLYDDESEDICTYFYDAVQVTQLIGVSHTHVDYQDSTFSYDSAGNLISDEKGRLYDYNSFNRLKSVYNSNNSKISDYIYDSRGFVAIQKPTGYKDIEYYYRGDTVINEYCGRVGVNSKIYNGKPLIRTVNHGQESTNQLMGIDCQGSHIVSLHDDGSSTSTENRRYSPFGSD